MASRIIYLNGCSSAGKTSIARAIQDEVEQPFLHVCIDMFEDMMPRVFDGKAFTYIQVLAGVIAGMHASINALARCGNNLIVDHILLSDCEPEDWVAGGLACVKDFDVLFVGVRCPLPVLQERERIRGDRREGLAAWQFDRVHKGLAYDLELDTSTMSPADCAQRILDSLERKFPPTDACV